uniref:Putative conserved protein with signal anchor n=1 Tax=Hyalomma excavatum TaxID=257692 RepID=A0A131XPM2_9ACAR
MLLLRKRLYRLMRRTFPSLEHADHETVKRRLSIAYAIVAWHGFVFTLYMVYSRNAPRDEHGIDYVKLIAKAEKERSHGIIFSLYQGKVIRKDLTQEDLLKIAGDPAEDAKEKAPEAASA